jgi:hypothetical protein
MIDRVLDAFDRWLAGRSPDARHHADVSDVVRTACELKSTFVEPNPADWSADVTTHIVGEVMPAKIIGVDPAYVATIIPGMQLYIDFLVQTGRWKPVNDEGATRAALIRLGDLAPRFGDPGRQSMAGRVLQVAADQGIDFSDPTALDEFLQRFNEMPLEWRQRMTDDPDAALSGSAEAGPGDVDQDDENEPVDPLGPDRAAGIAGAITTLAGLVTRRRDPAAAVTVPAAEEEWAALAGTPVCARVLDLADWAGSGRLVTSTGAMCLDDVRMWCDRWALSAEFGRVGSMWDVAAIALPWRIGLDCEVLELAGTGVGRGRRPTGGPVADRVRLGRAIVERLLDFVLVPLDVDKQLLDAVNHVMVPMLMSMCVPPGQALDGLDAMLAPREVPDGNRFYPRLVAGYVRGNISTLRDWGVVVESADHASVAAALRPGVVQTINSPLAPFRVTLTAGAVPLD